MFNEKILDSVGCRDGGCVFGKPSGMVTNGGCKCLDNYKRRYGLTKYLNFRKEIQEQIITYNILNKHRKHYAEIFVIEKFDAFMSKSLEEIGALWQTARNVL